MIKNKLQKDKTLKENLQMNKIINQIITWLKKKVIILRKIVKVSLRKILFNIMNNLTSIHFPFILYKYNY